MIDCGIIVWSGCKWKLLCDSTEGYWRHCVRQSQCSQRRDWLNYRRRRNDSCVIETIFLSRRFAWLGCRVNRQKPRLFV